ncbi:bile acid:sodium symporter family protein [Actinomadura miaoliensis]|uniref:bile acid:sodium symporter family protein n=1 Tax=Actinomadura miaoliensis TaxID=430685 RepID=UPI0031EAC546
MVRRGRVEPFVVAVLGAVGVAAVVPARGEAAVWLDRVVDVAITGLFFLYGVRLPTRQAVASMRNWRLHGVILAITFGVFPMLAFGCALLVPDVLDAGVVFLCVLPSTVQSSIMLTSLARGNEAAAICSASLSNLLGVVLTPALVAGMVSVGDGGLPLSVVVDTVLLLLAPFAAGQVVRGFLGDERACAWAARLKMLDRAVIVLAVYIAFGKGVTGGVWGRVAAADLAALLLVVAGLLAFVLACAALISRGLGFSHGDHIAVLFCGSQKSLASGLPMATVLFPGAAVGVTVLPLMLYHQLQLLVCTWLAQRLARSAPAGASA